MAFRPTDYYQTKGVFQMTRRFIEDDNSDMIDGILQPGGHFRVPMFLRDGVTINPVLNASQRAIAATRQHDAATFDAASHRPGHRYANDAAPLNDAQRLRYGVFDTAKEKAYADRDRELNNSWRGNTGAGTSTGSDTNNDSRRDAQPTMDAVYSEYDLRIQNSWRNQS
jgi:hypothetical protein